MENRDETFDCSCPFNGSRRLDDDGKATDPDATEAGRKISACKEAFLGKISAGWDEDISNVCTRLSTVETSKAMWYLYWCDTTFGLVDQINGHNDPTVNWIINKCHDKKLAPPPDPGVPPAAYELTCRASAELCRTIIPTASSEPSVFSKLDADANTQASQTTLVMSTRTTSTSKTGSEGSAAATHDIASGIAKTIITASPSATPMTSPVSQEELDTGTKAGIGVSTGVGALVLIFLAIWSVRRCFSRDKRSSYHQSIKAHIRHHCQRSSSSPTPLISPYPSHTNSHSLTSAGSGSASQAESSTTGAPPSPLSPPLRLRDRKFLPSLLTLNPLSSRSSSPPLTSLDPPKSPLRGYAFPASPVCRPEETTKLSPRPERSYPQPPHTPTLPPPVFPMANSLCGSGYSSSSPVTTAASSLRNEAIRNATTAVVTKPGAVATSVPKSPRRPPGSPVRPARPHEAPLHIPDLVSPASPTFPHPLSPPPRSPIPSIPTSRTQSISSGRSTPRPKRTQQAPTSVPAASPPVPFPTSPRKQGPKSSTNNSATPISTEPESVMPPRNETHAHAAENAAGDEGLDLAELSWEYARESAARARESWGSWTAGAPGLARGSGSGRSFSGGGEGLSERELERLGGGY